MPQTRYVPTTLPPVEIVGQQPLGVRELVRWLIDRDQRFNSSGAGIRASIRIDAALKASEGEAFTPIENDSDHKDWELLRDAAATPAPVVGPGYPINPARPLLPLIEAIRDAREQLPPPAIAAVGPGKGRSK